MDDVIYLEWNEDGFWTNLPRLLIEHNSKYYEWGSISDGSADLALNIIHWALERSDFADRNGEVIECEKGEVSAFGYLMHEDYQRQVIAKIPQRGTQIRLHDVWDWISKYPEPDFDESEE